MKKIKVIKVNIDLALLPGAVVHKDSAGNEWVSIPSVDEEQWKRNKDNQKEIIRNPSRVWAGTNSKTQMPKRIVSLDVVPYTGDKPEWGHTHIIKFYKGLKGVTDQKENNIILGNGKEFELNWKDGDYTPNDNKSYQWKTSKQQAPNFGDTPQQGQAPQANNNGEQDNSTLPF